jgi:hypothetical protein
MLSDFEIVIKRSFRFNHEQKKALLVDLRGVKDNKDNGIEDESIILKPYVPALQFGAQISNVYTAKKYTMFFFRLAKEFGTWSRSRLAGP